MVPCGHIPLITLKAKQKVTAQVVEVHVAMGRPATDFEATRICVGDGAGHPGEVTIAILGVCGHHPFHCHVWHQLHCGQLFISGSHAGFAWYYLLIYVGRVYRSWMQHLVALDLRVHNRLACQEGQ